MLEKDIKKVLVSHDEIVEAAKKLGETLTKEYQGKNPIFVGILKGSVPFMAELINHVDTHIELDFMLVSSYHGGTASSGIINIIKDIDQDITGRDILFVEDIIDTGKTLKNLKELFEERNAASVKIATLLDKPEGRLVEIEADYTCFTGPQLIAEIGDVSRFTHREALTAFAGVDPGKWQDSRNCKRTCF